MSITTALSRNATGSSERYKLLLVYTSPYLHSAAMRDLPIGTTPESREEPRLAPADEPRTPVGDYD